MNKFKSRIISVGGSVVIGGICAVFGPDIAFKDQWPLYDALRSTSSIIFAVIGAWLTILYPDAIKQVFSRGAKFSDSGVNDIELMVSNIRYSTAVLAIILVVGIAAQIFKTLEWAVHHAAWLRAISFAMLGGLTYLQFCTLIMTLAQAELAREKVFGEAARKEKVSRFNSQTQTLNSENTEQQ